MVVTDSELERCVRPMFLTFDGEVAPGEPFAHMIENAPLIAALLAKARGAGRRRCAAAVDAIRAEPRPHRRIASATAR